MDGLDPHLVRYDQLDALMPELEELTWSLDEPFDNHMTLIRAIYLAAHRNGLKVLLDGVGGDLVLAEGTHLARLLRRGRWVTAWREAVGQNRFWGEHYPAWRELYRSARSALATDSVRRLHHQLAGRKRIRRRVQRNIRESMIRPDFAQRIRLNERLNALDMHGSSGLSVHYAVERARSIDHPNLTVGRERYDRVSTSVGVESRDPFLDLRLVALCLRLPGDQKLGSGWPKIILRRTMHTRLPDTVRWRRGKEHLGWAFTEALMGARQASVKAAIDDKWDLLTQFVDLGKARETCRSYFEANDLEQADRVYEIANLAAWLHRSARRPQSIG